MPSLQTDTVDAVVRQMLDAMRNGHLSLVQGEPLRAMAYVHEAAAAHERLAVLFHGDPDNEALAGRILFDVIGQRMEAMKALGNEIMASPMPMADIVAFVAKPLDPVAEPIDRTGTVE